MPTNPIKTPISCLFLNPKPKTKAPNISVFKGVKEFKIEAIELSIFSIAKANKNAGKKVPTNPFRVK